MIRLAALVTLLLAFVPLAAGSPRAPLLAPCTLADGTQARCGRFSVPEDRARPEGRTISLRIAVVPARNGGAQPDPLVYLTGGPGGAATQDALGLLPTFSGINAGRDVVLVDQRGTGGSNRLECPRPQRPLTTYAAVRAYARSCLAGLDADPRMYTTVPAMDDLAEVLAALGYSQVNLYGGSYGATAAQYFLAQHPELVRAAILDGGTLLDVPIFELWAPNGEKALRKVLDRCARTPRCAAAYPRVRRETFEMIAALRRKPVRVQTTVIDAATAAGAVHTLTLSPAGAAEIPWIAHRAMRGDWVPLALAVERVGDGAIESPSLMFWSIVCSEPWARLSPARAAAAGRGTYMAERAAADRRTAATICPLIPKSPQPAWTKARVRSDVPVLIVVGGTDPQDPLSSVAGAARELPNSRTVVVPAGGHGSVQLGCVPKLAQRFVERGTAAGLDTSCASRYEPPPFVLPR